MKARNWIPLRDVDFILMRSIDDVKYLNTDFEVEEDWKIQTLSDLERHEGFRGFAYPDPLSKLGKKYRDRKYNWGFEPGDILLARYKEHEADGMPWTLGFGETRNVRPFSRISKKDAEDQLEISLIAHVVSLETIAPGWKKLPLFASTVLANMIYNMGLVRLSKFAPTISLIMEGRYEEAGARLRKTPWFIQTGSRAEELVSRLEKRRIEPAHLVVNRPDFSDVVTGSSVYPKKD